MKKSSFVEGTVMATLSIIIVKILGMLYVIPFYALVGTLGSSLYAYGYNIYVIFLDISSAGLPIAISKIIKEFNTLNMFEAKYRTYKLGKDIILVISIIIFLLMFTFAKGIAYLLISNLKGGISLEDVAFVIRCVSFAILVVPYLSVSKGYLQGHNIINVSSVSQVLEQVMRITIILVGSYLCLHVFGLSLRTAIGVSIFGAAAGGFVALIYVRQKIHKGKKSLGMVHYEKRDPITNKEIIKKIASYAIPFIIIDIAVSIYTLIDLILIRSTLTHLQYEPDLIHFINTSISTWGSKIGMIVTAIATGMSVSLIPNIVEAFTKKDWHDVNRKFNNAIQIIIVISIPMVIGLSLLSRPVWSIFYGNNDIGASILATTIFTSLAFNLYTVTSSTLQSLNKFKFVYISTLSGFLFNMIMDLPVMYFFHWIGIPPYFGAAVATFGGYMLSVTMAMHILKKQHNLNYHEIMNTLKKIVIPVISMILSIVVLKTIIPVNYDSRISCMIFVSIISIIGALIYLILCLKNNTLYESFGEKRIKKIIKKLTAGKISF